VTALWLLPFFPSPQRDERLRHRRLHEGTPAYGTLEDVRRLVAAAHERGFASSPSGRQPHLRPAPVVPAGRAPAPRGSPSGDWYVLVRRRARLRGNADIFTDTEWSNWLGIPSPGSTTGTVLSHQPDLISRIRPWIGAITDVCGFGRRSGSTASGSNGRAVPLRTFEGTDN